MKLYLTGHARLRMGERDITRDQIASVLRNPHLSELTPEDSIKYTGTPEPDRVLKVWVVAAEDEQGRPCPKVDDYGRVIVKSTAWRD